MKTNVRAHRIPWVPMIATGRRLGGSRFAALFAVGPLLTVSSASTSAAAASPAVTPVEVVNSLEGTFGVHPGRRRNHIKGTCASGEFIGTPQAAAVSRSKQFVGQPIPTIVRFSLAGGNPNVADSATNARGMALEFELPGGSKQHMTMLNTPVFGAASPNTFNDMIIAAKPDPVTGKPDQQKIAAFLRSHPDAMAQAAFLKSHNPPASYANSTYYSIHTFRFIDAGGVTHPVKWRFVPQDGERHLTDAELRSAPKDFLEQRLMERVARGPVKWDMVVYMGEPGDSEDNPTVTWPETRRHFIAGTLTITKATPQSGGACEKINFDPLVMADGIQPTSDPVLLFRSPAYAISYGKRLSNQ
jgi:catalase